MELEEAEPALNEQTNVTEEEYPLLKQEDETEEKVQKVQDLLEAPAFKEATNDEDQTEEQINNDENVEKIHDLTEAPAYRKDKPQEETNGENDEKIQDLLEAPEYKEIANDEDETQEEYNNDGNLLEAPDAHKKITDAEDETEKQISSDEKAGEIQDLLEAPEYKNINVEDETQKQIDTHENEEEIQNRNIAEFEQKSSRFEKAALDLQPLQNETLGEDQFAEIIINAEDQLEYDLMATDDLVTPPPTPANIEDDSPKELETEQIHEEILSEAQGGLEEFANLEEEPEVKKQKRAGFKTVSVSSNYEESEYGRPSKERVVTSVRDIEKEKQLAECNRFAGIENFASNFIDKIIDKSINNIESGKIRFRSAQMNEEDATSLSSVHTFVEIFGTFTRWPRIQEFSRELGESTINDYIQTWDYDEDWMYCIDFLVEQSDDCSDYYLYEAKWSIPSNPYPIPQATASVYFTVEVSRVKPNYCPVDVTYVFEGSRIVHTAGKIPFQEHWLFSIIDSKLEMYKQIKF